ncbi:uncharacterized protein LOC128397793 [Panonychus citri]|uniref:uncharacterized protein LOC128397793 n=1 Tax=Panonychus citri TaxID=50023 RepID=UPI002306F7C9|nr:uncharacterized protein LOC128397793 [Panonychus citri]
MEEDDDDDQLDYGDDITEELPNTVYLELLKPDVSLEKFGIPVTIDKFISSIIYFDPTFHGAKNFPEVMNVKSKLRSVTGKLTFESLDIYCLYYLPVVMYSFCRLMSKALDQKKDILKENPTKYYEDVYILMKEEFHSQIDFKLVKFRPKHEFEGPQAGDLAFIRAKCIRYPEDTDGTFEENYHFGLFLSSQTRVVKPEVYAIEHAIVNNYPAEERGDLICEESIVRVRHVNSLFLRNDYQLAIFKLVNCLFHMLQAKALYLLGANPCQEHFLNPVMVIKNSGVTIEENLQLPPEDLDTIQKAIDLVGQSDSSSSCFLAIDFTDPSRYNNLLEPILKQMILNVPFFRSKETESTPILIISKCPDSLKQLYENLIRDDYFGENGVILDPSPAESAQVDAKLISLFQNHMSTLTHDKEAKQKGSERYTKCIEYLEKNRSLDDLKAQWVVDMQRTRKEVKRRLIRKCKIILTNLDNICKDDQYLINFNAKAFGQHRILCCVLLDAHQFTETETVCLTNFGITKFILFGNSSIELPEEEQLTPKGLDRSLLHRLQMIDARNQDKSPYTSYVKR